MKGYIAHVAIEEPDTPVPLTTKIMLQVSAYLMINEVLKDNTMYVGMYTINLDDVYVLF